MKLFQQTILIKKTATVDWIPKSSNIKATLINHMKAGLSRVLSLFWSPEINQTITSINESLDDPMFNLSYDEIKQNRVNFIKSKMIKQSVLPQFVDCYNQLTADSLSIDDEKINFSSPSSLSKLKIDILWKTEYKYYPYFIQYKDILWWMLNSNLHNGESKINYQVAYNLFISLNNGHFFRSKKEKENAQKIPIFNPELYLGEKVSMAFLEKFILQKNRIQQG